MENAYLVVSYVAFAVSIALGKFFAFKYRQSEGKDSRNNRQVRLHGDGNFVSSIFNSVMQFIWGLLTVISFLCVLGAGFAILVGHGAKNEANKTKQEQIVLEAKTPEIKQEEVPALKPVIEAPQLEEQKNQANESGKTSESQEQNNLGEKDEARK
jgi:hypothetical protein